MVRKECQRIHPKTGVCRNHHLKANMPHGEVCGPECWRVALREV